MLTCRHSCGGWAVAASVHFQKRPVAVYEILAGHRLHLLRGDGQKTARLRIDQIRIIENGGIVAQLLGQILGVFTLRGKVKEYLVLCLVELRWRKRIVLQPLENRVNGGLALGRSVTVVHHGKNKKKIWVFAELG